MIFVTVGTHEQGFDRLVEAIDRLVIAGDLEADVTMQIGYTKYQPKACKFQQFYGFDEMQRLEAAADVVICHGGPSTFMAVLQLGKQPVVVPRQHQFDEHVNDHQVAFAQAVVDRGYPIIVVEDIKDLAEAIDQARQRVHIDSHNQAFVAGLKIAIAELF